VAIALAVATMIAARLSGSEVLGGFGLTSVVLGTAATALLVSRVAARVGRRPALVVGSSRSDNVDGGRVNDDQEEPAVYRSDVRTPVQLRVVQGIAWLNRARLAELHTTPVLREYLFGGHRIDTRLSRGEVDPGDSCSGGPPHRPGRRAR
jgi:hypothetical protein